jgi:hypothetical protein
VSFNVEVDIDDVVKIRKAAQKVLGERVGIVMKKTLDKAAALERRTHVYNNYTHRLENSTFALGVLGTPDEAIVEYGARMEYASFVDARGRTRVKEIGERAALELEYKFDGDADELSRG